MGVYHFAGLGKSIGAVTAAFSYLGALKQAAGPGKDAAIFELSGEMADAAGTRGSVEALVLFTTEEIINDNPNLLCDPYLDNVAGQTKGTQRTGTRIREALRNILRKEIGPLARHEDKQAGSSYEDAAALKDLYLYWCAYARHKPIETFERVARVLYATKPPGKVGKEVWINLTGGSNIINGALQLAASLTGTPAQMYYLLSNDPRCIRHTVHSKLLGMRDDHFWIDLPMVYLDFNPVQKIILDLLANKAQMTLDDLHASLYVELYENPRLIRDPANDREILVHAYLRPLCAQKLILYKKDEEGRDIYRIGPAWPQMRRYLEALPTSADEVQLRSLSELERQVNWLTLEKLELR